MLRTAALWAEIMTSPRVKLPGVPRVSPDSGQLFQTCIASLREAAVSCTFYRAAEKRFPPCKADLR